MQINQKFFHLKYERPSRIVLVRVSLVEVVGQAPLNIVINFHNGRSEIFINRNNNEFSFFFNFT